MGLCMGGACCAAVGALAHWKSSPPAGGAVFWACDRDAGRLVGLDQDLFETTSLQARAPLFVEACRAGGVWFSDAIEATPLSVQRLQRLSAQGEVVFGVDVGPLLDLATIDGGDAVAIELAPWGAARVLQVTQAGEFLDLFSHPQAVCVAGKGARIALGTSDGSLVLLEAGVRGQSALSEVALQGSLVDIAPSDDGWWVLDASGGVSGSRLLRLDERLQTLWQVFTSTAALSLVCDRARERVWLADTSQSSLRRFGPSGLLELALVELPASGLDRGSALRDGGVLLVAPGALLRFNADGQSVPGQGGFDFLVDVAGPYP